MNALANGDHMPLALTSSRALSHENITSKSLQLESEYKTYLDCSICTKHVKGESLCCSLCKHWAHRKCIGKFPRSRKNRAIDSFESMNEFYRDQDWFCLACLKSIFPFISLADDEFHIACLETFRCINPNMKDTCKALINLNVLNQGDNVKFDEESLHIEGIDLTKNSTVIEDSEYLFDFCDLKIVQEPEISVMNFNIRSIKGNFEQFTNILSNSKIVFDVITLTETWLDNSCNLEDFAIEGYMPPIVQNRPNRVRGGVLIYLIIIIINFFIHLHKFTNISVLKRQ